MGEMLRLKQEHSPTSKVSATVIPRFSEGIEMQRKCVAWIPNSVYIWQIIVEF